MNVQEDPLVDRTRGVIICFLKGKVTRVLQTIKPRKAAGFDGVYPEFIKNSGTRT
jgi:hypothetical protein